MTEGVIIVLHTKVMTHLVSHCCGNQTDRRAVIHRHSTGKFVSAHGTLQGLTDHSSLKLNATATKNKLAMIKFESANKKNKLRQ
jgi:hypothetical protein